MLLEMINGKIGDAERRLLDKIIHYVAVGNNMIEGLLRFSHLEQRQLDLSDTDMTEIANAVISLIDTDNVQIRINTMPRANADSSLIHTVFINLIGNAVKYGGTSVSVNYEDGAYCVTDNGIGIPEQHQEHVFEMFQRLHREEEYSGTGVGLALVKRIIEKHNGTIWYEQNEPNGTIFKFTIGAR